MRSLHFVERELDLREPLPRIGYGPDLAALEPERPSAVLVSLATGGAPSKLRRVDLITGAVQRGDSIRGSLRDAWSGDDLWVLATYALHRVSRDLSVKETLKVPHFLHRLVPLLSARFLALSQRERKRTSVLSLRTATLQVVTMPTPDISVDHDDRCVVLSFWSGEARGFDTDLKPTPDRRDLPLGLSAIQFGREILFLRPTRETARNVTPVQPEVKWLYSTGVLAAFDPTGWTIAREAAIGAFDELVGIDAAARIIATDYETRTLALIDPKNLAIVARHSLRGKAVRLVQAGPFAVVYRVRSGQLGTIDWSLST